MKKNITLSFRLDSELKKYIDDIILPEYHMTKSENFTFLIRENITIYNSGKIPPELKKILARKVSRAK